MAEGVGSLSTADGLSHPRRADGELVGGRYVLGRFIGAGAMGGVYECQHAAVKRRFAIKFLHPQYARSPDMLERFRREAESAGMVESENVAGVVDFGIAGDGAPFIVMELLEGETLAAILGRGGLSVERAAELVRQACRGVEAAHGRGLIHRDLKPSNLFVCPREGARELVKVLDFGIAKRTEPGREVLTATGLTLGTPLYMAPEQARGEAELDRRVDVYALGLILYEALTGARAHSGSSYNEVVYRILNSRPKPLAELRTDVPPGLVDVVARAMAFAPGDRFASARELELALAPFAGQGAESSQETRVPPRAAGDTSASGSSTARVPAATTALSGSGGTGLGGARRRRPWVWVVLAAAGVGGVAMAVVGRRDVPPMPTTEAKKPVPDKPVAPAAPPEAPAAAEPAETTVSPALRKPPARRRTSDKSNRVRRPGLLPLDKANPYTQNPAPR